MLKMRFLVIYSTFNKSEIARRVVPTYIEAAIHYRRYCSEVEEDNIRIIVHDHSLDVRSRQDLMINLRGIDDIRPVLFLLDTDDMSMAHSRNMCLALGSEMFNPDYILMVEDDHGVRASTLIRMMRAMQDWYGKVSPNGLRFGMFTGCRKCSNARLLELAPASGDGGGQNNGLYYPDDTNPPIDMGGCNSCFRCAPAHHWYSVLKGYDTDEYPISHFQTRGLRMRNYHKGFTTMYVGNDLVYEVPNVGYGESDPNGVKLWDDNYCASDSRAHFRRDR